MLYFSTIVLSVFITISLIPVMIRFAVRFQIVDHPDARKAHTIPMPRVGGLAMALGVSIPVILWTATDEFVKVYLMAAGVLVAFGLLDDIKGLGYKSKFLGQLIASFIVILYGGVRIQSLGAILPGVVSLPIWVSIALTLIAIIGVTNAINLSDGLDGLAGGISLLSFCCIGYLAFLQGNSTILLLSLALAGAIFGFLRFNTYPATLFMGDTGSQLLGFSAVVLALKLTQGDTPFSPILPLIILGFPVLDTLTVMVERAKEKRPLFSPDKKHFHHRLMKFGLSHAEAVFVIYLIQALMILSAFFFKYQSDWLLLTGYVAFSAVTVGVFAVLDRKAFPIPRLPQLEHALRDHLMKIRKDQYIIRLSFGVSKLFIPILLLISCFLPARIPDYVSITALCSGLLIIGIFLARQKYLKSSLRLVLYLTIPLVLYCIEEGRSSWLNEQGLLLYRLCFGILAVFMLLTVKFSRRSKGFRMSNMDFLIIFIAVTVPNLASQLVQNLNVGLLAVEIIIFYFGYEVLINELRERYNGLALVTLAVAAVLCIRGYLGI